MEASTLTHASRRGLLARRSPLLRLEGDERLVALIRSGHDRAFEVLFDRYHARLLAFCTSMLKSRQDAEDVLQEVFANAHRAMLADDRRLNVRPWLYRIARNRCLNHLRRPVPEGQDSMDVHPHQHGATTAERVQTREELRQVLADVGTLPETQRTALLLREIDQLSYEEIAVAMETTIPAVKSLLVRARIMLAESSEARTLSCDEVRIELAEAAEGIRKASGPVRQHVRNCEGCQGFREQLRSDRKALAAILPIGPLAVLKSSFLGKLFGGIGGGGGTAAAIAGGSTAGGTAGGLGALSGALGTKAAAGIATAALLTAGAVEVGGSGGSNEEAAPQTVEQPPIVQPQKPPAREARPQRPSRRDASAAAPAAAEPTAKAQGGESRSSGREAPAGGPATAAPVIGDASADSAERPADGAAGNPAGETDQWGADGGPEAPAGGGSGGLERPSCEGSGEKVEEPAPVEPPPATPPAPQPPAETAPAPEQPTV